MFRVHRELRELQDLLVRKVCRVFKVHRAYKAHKVFKVHKVLPDSLARRACKAYRA